MGGREARMPLLLLPTRSPLVPEPLAPTKGTSCRHIRLLGGRYPEKPLTFTSALPSSVFTFLPLEPGSSRGARDCEVFVD